MYDTHSLAEWAQMVSLAVGLYASGSAPVLLLAGAEVWAWPRPLTAGVGRVRCSLEAGRLASVWQVAVYAGHDLNWLIGSGHRAVRETGHAVRELGRDAAALLILLTTSPKGAMS